VVESKKKKNKIKKNKKNDLYTQGWFSGFGWVWLGWGAHPSVLPHRSID
jgi:hypothetical protein